MSQIDLGTLIQMLEKAYPDAVLPYGFTNPHSSRAYYHCVAFEPAYNVTVRDTLDTARSAVGATYQGYKGGDYTMDLGSYVYLAEEGTVGDELSELTVRLMISVAERPTEEAAPEPVVPPTPAEEVAAAAARIRGDWLGEVMDFGPFAEALAAWLEMVAETLASGGWQHVEVPDTIMTLVRIINKEG